MGQRVSSLNCCFGKKYSNTEIKMAKTEKVQDSSDEEPFSEAKFTISPNAFSDQYDMQQKLEKVEGRFVINEDRSITLITNSYVDGLDIIQQGFMSEHEDGGEISSANGPVIQQMVEKQTEEAFHDGPVHEQNNIDASLPDTSQELDKDKPHKRNRQLVQDLTPQASAAPKTSPVVNRSLSQKFMVDEHLWHYVLFKHADKVADISSKNLCEARVVSEFSKEGTSYFLEVAPYVDEKSGANDAKNSTENAVEEFAQLFQKVSNNPPIMEEVVKLPAELDKTEINNLKISLHGMGFLLMPSDLHRLIGPENRFEKAKNKVWEVADEHERKKLSALKDKDETLEFQSPNGLTVFVSRGDLVKQRVDAIVNPANVDLQHGGGAARAISKAAGHELNQECRDYIRNKGSLKTTSVMHTSAGNLQPKVKYVIHAVGPRNSSFHGEEDPFQDVKRTIYNCLHYANTHLEIRSIAIPAISSGIYGVPLETVAKASFAALVDFDKTLSTGPRVLNEIHFLNNDQPTVSAMRTTFSALLKTTFGSSVDPIDEKNQKLIDQYADAFGRERISNCQGKNCFAATIATALQKDFKRKVDSQSIEDQILKELKSNKLYYKDFQLKTEESWSLEWLKNLFTPSSLSDLEHNTDLLFSATANALKVEIVLVQLSKDQEPCERNFKPTSSSVDSSDSIYISFNYSGHSHFDALTKKTYDAEGKSSKHQSGIQSEQNHSNGAIGDQSGGHSVKSSNVSNGNFVKIEKRELLDFPPNRDASAKTNVESDSGSKNDTDEDNMCIICMDTITDVKVLPCKHKFCRECIDNCFEKHQPKCPSCGKVFGIMKGNQPVGSMDSRENKYQTIPGYSGCGTIEIQYSFRGGTQGQNHPNPGQPYRGTSRTAFLPGNKEGREVLHLLKRAFDAHLVFTIGRSNTTGQENVVIWNDVHHKTSVSGQYGYPDPTYLKRVKEELAAKGIQ